MGFFCCWHLHFFLSDELGVKVIKQALKFTIFTKIFWNSRLRERSFHTPQNPLPKNPNQHHGRPGPSRIFPGSALECCWWTTDNNYWWAIHFRWKNKARLFSLYTITFCYKLYSNKILHEPRSAISLAMGFEKLL